jgi:hypothetical protein
MRNEAMEQLDVLVGSWETTMRNAWFLEPADQEVPGSATVEWLDDAFVVFRWTMMGDVGKATSEMVLVLGGSDAQGAYTALYHDERGVCRVYAMTFDGSHWNLSRNDPDMFQRFIADVGPDRIGGRWFDPSIAHHVLAGRFPAAAQGSVEAREFWCRHTTAAATVDSSDVPVRTPKADRKPETEGQPPVLARASTTARPATPMAPPMRCPMLISVAASGICSGRTAA